MIQTLKELEQQIQETNGMVLVNLKKENLPPLNEIIKSNNALVIKYIIDNYQLDNDDKIIIMDKNIINEDLKKEFLKNMKLSQEKIIYYFKKNIDLPKDTVLSFETIKMLVDHVYGKSNYNYSYQNKLLLNNNIKSLTLEEFYEIQKIAENEDLFEIDLLKFNDRKYGLNYYKLSKKNNNRLNIETFKNFEFTEKDRKMLLVLLNHSYSKIKYEDFIKYKGVEKVLSKWDFFTLVDHKQLMIFNDEEFLKEKDNIEAIYREKVKENLYSFDTLININSDLKRFKELINENFIKNIDLNNDDYKKFFDFEYDNHKQAEILEKAFAVRELLINYYLNNEKNAEHFKSAIKKQFPMMERFSYLIQKNNEVKELKIKFDKMFMIDSLKKNNFFKFVNKEKMNNSYLNSIIEDIEIINNPNGIHWFFKEINNLNHLYADDLENKLDALMILDQLYKNLSSNNSKYIFFHEIKKIIENTKNKKLSILDARITEIYKDKVEDIKYDFNEKNDIFNYKEIKDQNQLTYLLNENIQVEETINYYIENKINLDMLIYYLLSKSYDKKNQEKIKKILNENQDLKNNLELMKAINKNENVSSFYDGEPIEKQIENYENVIKIEERLINIEKKVKKVHSFKHEINNASIVKDIESYSDIEIKNLDKYEKYKIYDLLLNRQKELNKEKEILLTSVSIDTKNKIILDLLENKNYEKIKKLIEFNEIKEFKFIIKHINKLSESEFIENLKNKNFINILLDIMEDRPSYGYSNRENKDKEKLSLNFEKNEEILSKLIKKCKELDVLNIIKVFANNKFKQDYLIENYPEKIIIERECHYVKEDSFYDKVFNEKLSTNQVIDTFINAKKKNKTYFYKAAINDRIFDFISLNFKGMNEDRKKSIEDFKDIFLEYKKVIDENKELSFLLILALSDFNFKNSLSLYTEESEKKEFIDKYKLLNLDIFKNTISEFLNQLKLINQNGYEKDIILRGLTLVYDITNEINERENKEFSYIDEETTKGIIDFTLENNPIYLLKYHTIGTEKNIIDYLIKNNKINEENIKNILYINDDFEFELNHTSKEERLLKLFKDLLIDKINKKEKKLLEFIVNEFEAFNFINKNINRKEAVEYYPKNTSNKIIEHLVKNQEIQNLLNTAKLKLSLDLIDPKSIVKKHKI